MRITTTLTSARNGAGNIVAKSRGRQKTTRYDHSLSREANHGVAAAALIKYIDTTEGDDNALLVIASIDSGNARHESNGPKHVFEF